MATEQAPLRVIPTQEYPPDSIPVIYADGVASVTPFAHTIKVYLYRTDPNSLALPESKNVLVAQLVFPKNAFIFTALFFAKCLRLFVSQRTIQQAEIDAMQDLVEPR